MNFQTVHVALGPRSYDVRIGAGILAELGHFVASLKRVRQAVVIGDRTVFELYGQRVLDSLRKADLAASAVTFPAGEEHKTMATLSDLFDGLFSAQPAVDRDTVIVALGGGVAGDMAGLLAALALRGLRWIQCPTSLLADVDASVGGKTAVDHPAGKNLIGAFHQPNGVLIDVNTLKTLPEIERQSGLAECIKHAAIRDDSLLEFIETRAKEIADGQPDTLIELVTRNVAIKAKIVSADEKESGERAHLNFGHTAGHGIEASLGYGELTHGQAVALGMVVACRIAEEKNLVAPAWRHRLELAMRSVGLATRREGLDTDAVWNIMQHDKKNRDGKVRFVLPTAPGEVGIFDDITETQVRHALAHLAE